MNTGGNVMIKNNMGIKVLTGRIGRVNPESIEEYINLDGYYALKKYLNTTQESLIEEIKHSGLKGRGGAGFPTGIKMESVFKSDNNPKYLICNADEGEPGNFKDKYLMENDPHQLIEGMILCAYGVGAAKGYIYIRGEYNKSIKIISNAIEQAKEKGFLGNNIMDTGYCFDLELRSGAGAYICGEEYALIESLEGKAGRPRHKPPYPPVSGLYNQPTLLNNVETFSNIPYIALNGAEKFKDIGTYASSGTKLISISGNVRNRGVCEIPFGVTLRQIIEEFGGGVPNGRQIKVIQLGGASGPCIPPDMLDIKLDFDEFAKKDLSFGSGAVIVIDDRYEVIDIMQYIMKFFEHESCGKCTPCREGNRQILNILKKFAAGIADGKDISRLEILGNVMMQTSYCGLGQAAPTALMTTLKYFRNAYAAGITACNTVNSVDSLRRV